MKKLILTGFAVLSMALAAPSFAGGKADKADKPNHKQENGGQAQRGEKIFAKIEEKLGHELTAEQKQQITDTTRNTMQDMKPIQQSFVQSIATAVKISPEEVKAAMRTKQPKVKGKGKQALDPESRICSGLEAKLDRKLSDEEIKAIEAAIETRKTAAKPIQHDYVEAMAKITGLTADQLGEILPKQLGA